MYEGDPKEILDKIEELGLWGKSLEEIVKISLRSCSDIKFMTRQGRNKYSDFEFNKKVEQLELNQIKILEKIKEHNL